MNKQKASILIILTIVLTISLVLLSGLIGETSLEERNEDVGDNQKSKKDNLNSDQNEILFNYQATFQYLSSQDNDSIELKLFTFFPCPIIDNKPIVSTTSGNISWLENSTWKLLAQYRENGENVWRIEVDNGDPVEFVEPRKARPYPTYLYVQDTPLGKKISLELGSAFDNAFYLNEIAQINTEFTVPIENASKVTLLDNLGKISGRAFGYTSEGYKSIQYSMKVSLSKKINGTWETESFEYNSENLLPVTEWVELTLNF